MQSNKIKHGGILVAVSLLVASPAFAINFGNMMNPGKWFGGNNDRYDDDYYYDDWGPGYPPPPGAGYGAYGAPGYGYPGYAAPGYGGAPAYGYPGVAPAAPGYTAPAYSAPESSSSTDSLEVERLKRRVRELEEQTRQNAESAAGQYDYQPAPMPTPAPYGEVQPAASGGQPAAQPGYGTQQSYGVQQGYGSQPAGQGTQWQFREDPSLPPLSSQ